MTQNDKAKSAISAVRVRPMSTQVAEVRQNINLIQEALKATMKKDVHFGTIPGCPKPSLYKAGAEVILALFRLTTDPDVNDMSKDQEIRYQVKVNVKTRDGIFVGSGIGECSSGEEKFMWRSAICQEEFESTPETLRRIKFKKVYGKIEQIQQVRVSPSDMANTILKMAKKRAMIDAVLTATGASDIFSQDIEDLPEGYVSHEVVPEQTEEQPPQETAPTPEQEQPVNLDLISEPQRKRMYVIAMKSGLTQEGFKNVLKSKYNLDSSKDVTRLEYEKICNSLEVWKP
jgi:hypothetical protein